MVFSIAEQKKCEGCSSTMAESFLNLLKRAEARDKWKIRKQKPGTYTTVCRLGRGATGEILHVRRKSDDVHLALKVVRNKVCFENEIVILKTLNECQCVVQMYDAFESLLSRYVMVLELASMSFRGFLRSNRAGSTLVLHWLRALQSAVCEIHRLGIVHRDLKPENILLWKTTRVLKLCDFGMSTFYSKHDQECKLMTVCGTPSYMAPEFFTSKRYSGRMVDTWAFGCIVYECIVGVHAFDACSLKDLRLNICRRKLSKGWNVIPEEWKPIVLSFLQPVKTRLHVSVVSLPITDTTKTSSPPLRRPALRRPALRRPPVCRPPVCRPPVCRSPVCRIPSVALEHKNKGSHLDVA